MAARRTAGPLATTSCRPMLGGGHRRCHLGANGRHLRHRLCLAVETTPMSRRRAALLPETSLVTPARRAEPGTFGHRLSPMTVP